MNCCVFCLSLGILTVISTTTTTGLPDVVRGLVTADLEKGKLEDRFIAEAKKILTGPIIPARSRVEDILAMLCRVCRLKKKRRCVIRYCTSDALFRVAGEPHEAVRLPTEKLAERVMMEKRR